MYRILKMAERIDVHFSVRPVDILDVSKHSHILSFFSVAINLVLENLKTTSASIA